MQATGITKDGKSRTINLLLNITAPVVTPVKSSLKLVIILAILLLLLPLLYFFWIILAKRRKKEESDVKDLEENKVKADLNSFDDDEINARIEAMVKRQALSKKRATVKKKAAAKKAAVRKKASKV